MAGLLIASCGNSEEPTLQGKFANGPVAGLSYSTSAGINGTTDISGAFNYRDSSGETVSFKIGSVSLGSAKGAAFITPLDLVSGAAVTDARVLNRVQLLQTLDSDKDIDNGISIDQALAAKLNDSIKPDETDGTKFETALKSALGVTPVNRALARESFESGLSGLGRSATTIKEAITGGSVTVNKHRVYVPTSMFVPYEGT
ncbi:MAG: hypothetical protein EBX63_02880, partial [Betaproteobacteria bacterium]|nr:hypothetical protein [Betaproteobacteria bacterium]